MKDWDLLYIGKKWGASVRKRRLREMLFSGIEFRDFKGMSKCNRIFINRRVE